jgi:hypothetical protein
LGRFAFWNILVESSDAGAIGIMVFAAENRNGVFTRVAVVSCGRGGRLDIWAILIRWPDNRGNLLVSRGTWSLDDV